MVTNRGLKKCPLGCGERACWGSLRTPQKGKEDRTTPVRCGSNSGKENSGKVNGVGDVRQFGRAGGDVGVLFPHGRKTGERRRDAAGVTEPGPVTLDGSRRHSPFAINW